MNASTDLLERICGVGGQPHHESDRRSLLHAYIACLDFRDLCSAILTLLGAPVDVRLALRGRLLRLLRSGADEQQVALLEALSDNAATEADNDKQLRQVVDALHSAIFGFLPPTSQHQILERWAGRSARGAMARWLKATKEQPAAFDADVAIAYWRASGDARAAKSIAYQADPALLPSLIPELVQGCREGWIIARAIIRAGGAEDECWELIHAEHPATYLYLCAQLKKPVDAVDAFDLVYRCEGLGVDGGRGLAIWAVGQMGMVAVLDRITASIDQLQERDLAAYMARHPQFEGASGDSDCSPDGLKGLLASDHAF